jgi:hypothetical protein
VANEPVWRCQVGLTLPEPALSVGPPVRRQEGCPLTVASRHLRVSALLLILTAAIVCSAEVVLSDVVGRPSARGRASRDSVYTIYFGNLHSHTSYSDGVGIPQEAYEHARYVAQIDFHAVTDHHNWLTAEEYQDIMDQAVAITEDGAFIGIGGQEWSGIDTASGKVNHITVHDADHVFEAPLEDLDAFYDELYASGCPGTFCHPEPEAFNNFAYSSIGDTRMNSCEIRNERHQTSYIKALNNGWHVGVDGSQDNHDATWGDGPRWTAALLCSLTKADILDAVNNHRTYSTYDRNFELYFKADGHYMGDSFAHAGNLLFSIGLYDGDSGDDVRLVELYQNGVPVAWEFLDADSCLWCPEISPPRGESYYFVKVYQEDGEKVWSAPMWIDCTIDLPSTPLMASPTDSAKLNTFFPTFSWHPSDTASTYTLQCSDSDSFPQDGSTVTVTGIADTLYTLGVDFKEETDHYWRVRAVNGNGSSTYSGTWMFHIARVPMFTAEAEMRLTTHTANDAYPAISQIFDETWLAWCSRRDGNWEVYYKTSADSGETWSAETRLTDESQRDLGPAIAADTDGRAWIVWQSARDYDWEIYCTIEGDTAWSSPANLTSELGIDIDPALACTPDSLMWLLWSTDRRDDNFELFYMTCDGDTWSDKMRLTHDSGDDIEPALTATPDGEVWAVWGADRVGNFEIYGKTYDGCVWSGAARLTQSHGDETNPSIGCTQDGMIWLTYAREGELYYKTHQHGSWSLESLLPTGLSDRESTTGYSSVTQTPDERIWIVYDGILNGNGDLYGQRSNHPAAITGVADPDDIAGGASRFALSQNYPNPFNPATTIQYELTVPSRVRLDVYDPAGRHVRTLLPPTFQEEGVHTVAWRGRDDAGRSVAAGAYFCRLHVDGDAQTRKLVLLK